VITGPGFEEVIICHQPVARKGDTVTCITGDVGVIVDGCESVIIGGQPVAKKGSKTSHGGIVLMGCPRVKICQSIRSICKGKAALRRAAFIRYRPRAPLDELV
jgi:uncharacterized Zn-binding protein involved in type VI secretion